MRQIWYEYIKRNVDLYFVSGLAGIAPPWFETKPDWYRLAWYVYHNLTDLIVYVITITNFIGAVLLTDIFDVFASLPPLIHGIQMSGRVIILQSRKAATEAYIKELNELLLEDTRNPIEESRTFREIHAADFKMNQRLTSLEFFSLIMSNIVFFVPECVKSFICPEEAHVIIVSWYPYDANINLYKQLTNFAHTFCWLLINFKMASFDTLFQSLIIVHTSQFRQLRYLFGKVLPEEKAGVVPFTDVENRALDEKLRWWIRQHQKTLSVTKMLEEICSPLLFFSYIECLSNMCLCAFLTTVSVLVPELGYNVTIFRSLHKVQKSVAMIFNRIYIPVKFSAMRLFYLNSKYYGSSEPPKISIHKNLEALKSEYSNVKHPSAIKLIPAQKPVLLLDNTITNLTKAELMEYINDPFWRNVRRFLLGGTIATFVVFFVAALSIIFLRSDCVFDREYNATGE
ncbi:UNVERIFIED_CONTAM: hypothetical protein PYX00_007478 [Menopon gallinae]|uniref:Odorant receptor n=1 Tax=Menopon gallinae TaxID=328185 RepID=A0AAW2HJ44_9NEOP